MQINFLTVKRMAYNRKNLEAKALEAIKKNSLFFIEDVVAFLPCSKATFYNLELDKLDTIKEALEENRTVRKSAMRKKWYDSDNPTLQIALYKMICSDPEFKRLTGQHIDHTTDGKEIQPFTGFNFLPTDDSKPGND